jgi:hypothetical protein
LLIDMLRHIEGPADVHTRLESSMRPDCGCETSDFTEDEYREVRVVVDGNYKRNMVDKIFLEPQNWRQSTPLYSGNSMETRPGRSFGLTSDDRHGRRTIMIDP